MRLLLIFFIATTALFAKDNDINIYDLKYDKLKIENPKITTVPIIKASASVLYINDKKTNFFKTVVEYPFGSINDRKGFEGETYFTFKTLITGGSEKFPVNMLDSLKDVLSISLGFHVSKEYSSISMTCLNDKKDIALEIFSDIISHPAFDSATLFINKRSVEESIIRELEEPSSFASKKFKEFVYGINPYGLNTYGDTTTLKKINTAVLRDCYQRIQFIGDEKVGIVGDVDIVSAPIIAWNILGNTNKKEVYDSNQDIISYNAKKEDSVDVIFYNKKDLNQTVIRWGNEGILYSNEDYYKLNMATSILGGGSFNSRLMNEIRVKRGLSYSVGYYSVANTLKKGYLVGACQTQTAKTGEALLTIMNTTDEYIKNGVTQEELDQFKKTFVNNMPFLYDSYAGYLNTYLSYLRQGRDVDKLKKLDKIYSNMSIKDVNETIKKYINKSDKTKFVLVGNYEAVKENINKIFKEKNLRLKVIDVE